MRNRKKEREKRREREREGDYSEHCHCQKKKMPGVLVPVLSRCTVASVPLPPLLIHVFL